MINQSIEQADPELHKLILQESSRQLHNLELIASENFTSTAVLQANASILTNKYSEGYPGHRFYGGTEIVDQVELLCQKRALDLFNLDPSIWGVNVQCLSGSPANFAVYTALIGPKGKLMGLDLPCGGHLTHGYQTKTRKVSATSLYFTSQAYILGKDNLMDYEHIETSCDEFKPDIFVVGASAYPRDFNYKRLKEICEKNQAFLMADISHISGIVACGQMNNPFKYADVVTTTTHKTLRGPRGALIFYRKTKEVNGNLVSIEDKINYAVFPMLFGGPHNQTIAAIAVALKQAQTQEYKDYINNVILNAKCMSRELISRGYEVLTGGTDCHLLLVDMLNQGITGSIAEKVCGCIGLTINKNMIPGSKNAMNPRGVRLGSPALTTRGFKEKDFVKVIEYFDLAIQIGKRIASKMSLAEDGKFDINVFEDLCMKDEEVLKLRAETILFVEKFPYPYFDYLTK